MISFSDTLEIIITGIAGQGAVSAGRLIAEAVVQDGLYATQTSRTAVAVRSGFSEAHVIISKMPVDFPFVTCPDVLIVLRSADDEQCAFRVKEGGLVISNSSYEGAVSSDAGSVKTIHIPATDIAASHGIAHGNDNLLLVGALAGVCTVPTLGNLQCALRERMHLGEDAEKALCMGARIAHQM